MFACYYDTGTSHKLLMHKTAYLRECGLIIHNMKQKDSKCNCIVSLRSAKRKVMKQQI